jgi:hypothetical protein
LYVQILFGFQLTGFLILAAMAMVVHALVNQKYVANVIVVLTSFAIDVARELGLRHNLVLYGGTPDWSYSEIAGFGGQVGPWLWFTLYWTGWALLFGIVTYLFWIRGKERGVRTRIALARRRLTHWPAAIGALAVAVIVGAGGFVFYNTNVRNHYDSDAQRERRSAEYERRYRKYAAVAQPVLAATKLQVDFYPSRGAATIRGTYRLENRSAVPIDAIQIATSSRVATRNVTFDRPSRPTLIDNNLGFRTYTLGRALQPGQAVRMDFEVDFEPHGFTNEGADPTVIANGSWIEHRGEQTGRPRQWLPAIGYEPGRELSGGSRALYGLPVRAELASLEDEAARQSQRSR